MVRVTRAIEFSRSLRYWNPRLDDAENRRLFGAQARRHGHNYRLEIGLRGEPDAQTGMVFNLSELKRIAEREIMQRFDHRDLNEDTDCFDERPPTLENFARGIFPLLERALPAGLLDRIRLYEGADFFADVITPETADVITPETADVIGSEA